MINNYLLDDNYLDFMKEVSNYKLLSQEEILILINKAKLGDINARNKIIESNLKLVVKIALKYRNYGLPILDLVNSGTLSLIRAIEKYDTSKVNSFSTYASFWIRQGIIRDIEDHSKTIRIPSHLHRIIKILKQINENYHRLYGYYPNDLELLEEYQKTNNKIKLDIERIKTLKQYFTNITSLNETIKEKDEIDEDEIINIIKNPNDEEIENIVIKKEEKDFISNILNGNIDTSLTDKEKFVLLNRFGFIDNQEKTLVEIGNILGLTKERIRQIEARALNKLRMYIKDNFDYEYKKNYQR